MLLTRAIYLELVRVNENPIFIESPTLLTGIGGNYMSTTIADTGIHKFCVYNRSLDLVVIDLDVEWQYDLVETQLLMNQ